MSDAVSDERLGAIRTILETFAIQTDDLIPVFAEDARWQAFRDRLEPVTTDDVVFAWVALGQRDKVGGLDQMREAWLDWFEPWTKYSLQTYEVRPVGPDIALAFARQVGTPRDGSPIEMDGVAVIRLRGDKIASVDFYASRDEALADVGEGI